MDISSLFLTIPSCFNLCFFSFAVNQCQTKPDVHACLCSMKSEQRHFIEMDNSIAESCSGRQDDPAMEFGYYYHTLLEDVCNPNTPIEAPSIASTWVTAISYEEYATNTPIYYTVSNDDKTSTSVAAASVTTYINYTPITHSRLSIADETEILHPPSPPSIYTLPTPEPSSTNTTPLLVNRGRGIVPRSDSVTFFSSLPSCAEPCYNDLSISQCARGVPYEECICLPETLSRTYVCALQYCTEERDYAGAELGKYRAAISAFCNDPMENDNHPSPEYPEQPPSYSPSTQYSLPWDHPMPPQNTPPPPYSPPPDYPLEETPTPALPSGSDTITASECETETLPPPPERYESPTYCATVTETFTSYIQGPGHKRQGPATTPSSPLLQSHNNLDVASSVPPTQVSAAIIPATAANSGHASRGAVTPVPCLVVVFLVLGVLVS